MGASYHTTPHAVQLMMEFQHSTLYLLPVHFNGIFCTFCLEHISSRFIDIFLSRSKSQRALSAHSSPNSSLWCGEWDVPSDPDRLLLSRNLSCLHSLNSCFFKTVCSVEEFHQGAHLTMQQVPLHKVVLQSQANTDRSSGGEAKGSIFTCELQQHAVLKSTDPTGQWSGLSL